MTVDIAENQTENPFGVSKEFIKARPSAQRIYYRSFGRKFKAVVCCQSSRPLPLRYTLLKAYTSYYKENIEDWKAVLPSVEYNIDTQIEVKYVGNGAENI